MFTFRYFTQSMDQPLNFLSDPGSTFLRVYFLRGMNVAGPSFIAVLTKAIQSCTTM